MSLLMRAVTIPDVEYGLTEMSDERLVSRAKSGDENAFVELCKRHTNRVFQSTYRVTRNRQDAEDALQNSFMSAFTHIKEFEGKSSFSTWLTRIAINSALMILRKKRNCCEISFEGDTETFAAWEPRSPLEDPESLYVREERQRLLRKAVNRLPPVCREVIQLRDTEEYSAQEIAKTLDITVSAVKSRLSRAKGALRRSMIETDSNLLAASKPSRIAESKWSIVGKSREAQRPYSAAESMG
jgi:RNA polymerase sigma-70 factor (ECF subfamily)